MKRVVFKPSQNKEKKVPVRDLPAGTIFCLHSNEDKVYQKVKGHRRNGSNVCAIQLGTDGYFKYSQSYKNIYEDSTDYTIITDFSQLSFEE